MKLDISTPLDCTIEQAWQAVRTSKLLTYITHPLTRFEPIQPTVLPEVWSVGDYQVSLKIFGFIPFGKHTIRISILQQAEDSYQIRDNGFGDVISVWDHLITLQKTAEGKTYYTDNVEIKAGALTFFVWLYAQVFYRYRQLRWRKLVQNQFVYPVQ